MIVVDEAIEAALLAGGVRVHIAFVPTEPLEDKVTVSVPLPYAVYNSNVGNNMNPRLSGRRGLRDVYFSLMYVGETHAQTKQLGERCRALLDDRRITVPGHKTGLCQAPPESARIFRDDDAIAPDGSPLFYGQDYYSLPVSITHTLTAEGATP